MELSLHRESPRVLMPGTQELKLVSKGNYLVLGEAIVFHNPTIRVMEWENHYCPLEDADWLRVVTIPLNRPHLRSIRLDVSDSLSDQLSY